MHLQIDKLQSLKELILNKDIQLLQVTSIHASPQQLLAIFCTLLGT